MENKQNKHSLLNHVFDITVLGIILTLTISFIESRITGQSIIIICCFLATTFIWKMLWPLGKNRQAFDRTNIFYNDDLDM